MVSALARHVGFLDSTVRHSAELFLASERLTNLRRWKCRLPQPLDHPIRFPSTLRALTLNLSDQFTVTALCVNRVMASLVPLHSLDALEISFRSCDPVLNFSPLKGMRALRSFTFSVFLGSSEMTDAQVDQIRGLTQLHSISVTEFATLPSVLRAPHELRWTKLGAVPALVCLTDAVSTVLPSLPSLTSLCAIIDGAAQFDCFQALPALHCLTLSVSRLLPEAAVAALAQGLKHAVHLTHLTIVGGALTNEQLATITVPMHDLQILWLTNLLRLDGLGFLTAAGSTLCSTLYNLSILKCPLVSSEELIHVHSMRKLRSLQLNLPLDPLCLALYRQRPCALIPTLEIFLFEQPIDD